MKLMVINGPNINFLGIRENRLEKKNRASGNLWDSNKSSSIHIISVQKESREKEVLKENSKK